MEALVDACVDQLVSTLDPAPITQGKCGVGKRKCVATKATGLLKCHQLALTPGKPVDPNAKSCVDKATAKFTGGADPAKGCFAKLEAKSGNDCTTVGDSAALGAIVDQCVALVVASLDGGGPVTTTTITSTTIAPLPTTTTTTTIGGTPVCGNGIPEAGEECDDGNDDNNDACVAGCRNARCGDGYFHSGVEQCDDGNTENGDGCSSTCTIEPAVCGNGRVEGDETCDDGNTDDGDACPSNCRIGFCSPSGAQQATTITYAKPGGVNVGSIVVFVDYPDGRASLPGFGNQATVRARITNLPTGFVHTANDLDYAIREVITPSLPGNVLGGTQLFRASFDLCTGQPAPTAAEYGCTVEQAYTPQGVAIPLPGFSCTVGLL
ncbi:MAG: DUF4215 domain-containing protein [bacterium]|nr:DUF4215 domain-containing protein [bacterium]